MFFYSNQNKYSIYKERNLYYDGKVSEEPDNEDATSLFEQDYDDIDESEEYSENKDGRRSLTNSSITLKATFLHENEAIRFSFTGKKFHPVLSNIQ